INEECWDLLSFHSENYSSLLVATNEYIYSIDDQKHVSNLMHYGPWKLYRSKVNPSRIFLGLDNGFASIYWDGKKWIDEGPLSQIKESVRSITEDKDGSIWLGHLTGAIKINFKNNSGVRKNADSTLYTYKKYATESGLPDGNVEMENLNNTISFFTVKGIYKIQNEKFSPDKTYGAMFSDGSRQVHRASYDKNTGKIWLETYYSDKNLFEFGYLTKGKDGTYSWITTPFLPYSDEIFQAIYHDGNGITWFGGAAGVFRYNEGEDFSDTKTFNSIIRKVTIGNDSTIFNGTFSDSANTSSIYQNQSLKYSLPFSNNSITFEFSALDFVSESTEQFQYYLEGFDSWSHWRHETKAVYTNLPEGKYFFHVKAKNIFNEESRESVYEFKVLPPWYRTWWAYVLYFLSSIGFIWAVVTYVTRGLKAIIRERTAEIVKQKEEIEYINR
ncbi:MAG TPA: triple tyrosine motif-containing protein, partial [Bacteroidia bacterium]